MDIIGYVHSDDFALCPICALQGLEEDNGSDDGYVQPIFDGSEWDFIPTCDFCHEPIEGVTVIKYNTYSVLVSNVGWVLQDSSDYKAALALYNDYVGMAAYEQVTLWERSDGQEEPIQEHYLDDGL